MKLNRLFRKRLPLLSNRQDRIGEWFRQEGQRAVTLAKEASRKLKSKEMKTVLNKETTRPAVIHGDVTRLNVISTSDKIVLIDWVRSRKGSVYTELARVLANIANFSIPLLEALLRGYETTHPLTKGERRLISALFQLPCEVWYSADHIVSAKPPKLFEIVKETWNDRLAAVEWVSNWANTGMSQTINKQNSEIV